MSVTAYFDQHRRDRERNREFRLILVVGYPLFLVGAVASRLLAGAAPAGAERRRSVFAEARATAYRTIPYAF